MSAVYWGIVIGVFSMVVVLFLCVRSTESHAAASDEPESGSEAATFNEGPRPGSRHAA